MKIFVEFSWRENLQHFNPRKEMIQTKTKKSQYFLLWLLIRICLSFQLKLKYITLQKIKTSHYNTGVEVEECQQRAKITML